MFKKIKTQSVDAKIKIIQAANDMRTMVTVMEKAPSIWGRTG